MILEYTNRLLVLAILAISASISVPANAQNVAQVIINEQSISIQGNEGYQYFNFTIVGPENFRVENRLGEDKLSMVIDDFSTLKDGYYRYEITAASSERKDDGLRIYNDGREDRKTIPYVPAVQTGSFLLRNGVVMTSDKRIKNLRAMTEGADQDEE